MKHLPTHPSHSTADSVRRLLFGNSRPSSSAFLGQQKTNTSLASWSTAGNGSSGEDTEIGRKMCSCLSQLEQICIGPEFEEFVSGDGHYVAPSPSPLAFNSEMGRMLYTISILLMFSLVILLLMFRSIRRSRSTVEVETLLDAMRFREELDLQQRQKKRLRKAKKKVTAWLCRGNGAKLWQLSPHILLPSQQPAIIRTNSLQSSGSFIPEIVISEHLPPSNALGPPEDLYGRTCIERQNSYTPSLSLIYDFSSRRNSQMCSSSLDLEESSENGRLSQSSGLSGSGGGGGAALKEESSSSGGADGGIAMKEVPTRGKPIVVGGK